MNLPKMNICLLLNIFAKYEEFWILIILAVTFMITAILFAYKFHDAHDNQDIVDSLVSENSKYCDVTRTKRLKEYKIRMLTTAIFFAIISIILYIATFYHI